MIEDSLLDHLISKHTILDEGNTGLKVGSKQKRVKNHNKRTRTKKMKKNLE